MVESGNRSRHGNQIRLRILKASRISDLCGVCVLVELMDCEYSKLSYHLKLLKEAGLIDCTNGVWDEDAEACGEVIRCGLCILDGLL
ncbi:ArsR family transcriptional regulator [Methanophagales archaeon]|nr:MAG: ArsR family transcriptional regulator [Methanophagales archaeon]